MLDWLLPRLIGHWDGGLAEDDCVARLVIEPSGGMVDGLARGLAAELAARTTAEYGGRQAEWLAGRPFTKMDAKLILGWFLGWLDSWLRGLLGDKPLS